MTTVKKKRRDFTDLRGKKIGLWTVIRHIMTTVAQRRHKIDRIVNRKRSCWVCRCECGATKIVQADNLLNGTSRSCGCLRIAEHNARMKAARTEPTLSERVVDYINNDTSRVYTRKDFDLIRGTRSSQTMTSALSRAIKAGHLQRCSRGRYRVNLG